MKKQVTDFLKNSRQYEEDVKDVLQPYYIGTSSLPGFADEEGTDAYYRRS
jgi:aryl-alcohol dehydrogenase-like predicted oxidoreductase